MKWTRELAYALWTAQRRCEEDVVRAALRRRFPALDDLEIEATAVAACRAVTAARAITAAQTPEELLEAIRQIPALDSLPNPSSNVHLSVTGDINVGGLTYHLSHVLSDSVDTSSEEDRAIHLVQLWLEGLVQALRRSTGR